MLRFILYLFEITVVPCHVVYFAPEAPRLLFRDPAEKWISKIGPEKRKCLHKYVLHDQNVNTIATWRYDL